MCSQDSPSPTPAVIADRCAGAGALLGEMLGESQGGIATAQGKSMSPRSSLRLGALPGLYLRAFHQERSRKEASG